MTVLVLAVLMAAGIAGCGEKRGGKVLVIGLDGATWELLDRWIAQGDLPNLASFREGAAWGELTSVVPYLSPPAWTSAVTGVNPGRHGIFDFQRRVPGSGLTILQETSKGRRSTPIWEMIRGSGLRSAFINIPMTDPPDELDGIMISGLPHVDQLGWSYPQELAEDFPDYILDSMEMRVPEGGEDSVLTHVHDVLERRWEAVRDIYQREEWDLFWVVFTQTDRIQHMFWGYMEPYDPRFTPEHARKYEEAVHDLWVRQDEILGELLAMTDPSTTVLMISDHGFGPISREIRVYPHLRRQNESKLLRESALQIYSIDPTNASQLYVQVKGRDANASLDQEAQRKLLKELRRVLDETVDPETGERIVARSWLNDEVFYGTYADKGPDVTFLPKRGYFLFKAETDAFNGDIDPVGPLSFSLTGWHQMNGIYALRGPCAEPGRRDDDGKGRKHNLMDVTPTLLYLLGRPVPEGLDGRVMTNIFLPECFESTPVEFGPAFDEYRFEGDEIPDSTEIERLKALPYIGG